MQLFLNGRFGSSGAARQLGSGNRGGRVTNLRVRKRRASNDAFAPCCASDDSPPPVLATLRIRVSNPRLAGPMPPQTSPPQRALPRVGRTGYRLPTCSASATHEITVDSNLVHALIIVLGRVLRRLLQWARAVAKLMVGDAGDLTRTRADLKTETALLRQQLIVLPSRTKWPRLYCVRPRALTRALARLTSRW